MSRFVACVALIVLSFACGSNATKEAAARKVGLPPGDWRGRCDATRDHVDEVMRRVDEIMRRDTSGKPALPSRKAPSPLVIDQANILDATSESEILREVESFHRETCHKLAVVTVMSLHGVPLEDFSLWLNNTWGLGYANFSNGLMLLIAPNDRSARIEVGCGLEDVVPDEAANDIMKTELIPAFRVGDYTRGVRAGLKALMERARQKQIPPDYRPAECSIPRSR